MMKVKSEKKTVVYQCKYFEFDDNDPSGCGGSICLCHSPKSGKMECDGGRYVHSQKLCPFYEKGPFRGRWVIGEAEMREAKELKEKSAAMKAAEEDKMPDKVKRNFENYATRHKAYLVYKKLCDSGKCPYWFEDDGVHAYIAVDFHEWIWLPVSNERGYPISWKKKYIGLD